MKNTNAIFISQAHTVGYLKLNLFKVIYFLFGLGLERFEWIRKHRDSKFSNFFNIRVLEDNNNNNNNNTFIFFTI